MFPDAEKGYSPLVFRNEENSKHQLIPGGGFPSDDGSTLKIYLSNSKAAIAPGDRVSLSIENVTSPSEPDRYTLDVSTSRHVRSAWGRAERRPGTYPGS